jgi:predicted RNA-binding Zn-ribbon protein involved in translation (DUF1610 family)
MERANRLTCPSCGTGIKSVRGVRIGRKIQCPRCGVAFIMRPEDAEQAEEDAGVNSGRLVLVLTGALLYLSGGAVLAFYCFTHNAVTPQHARGVPAEEQPHDEEIAVEPPAVRPLAAPGPVSVSTAEQRRIDNAIARGVWWLKDHVLATGTWGDAVPDGAAPVSVGFASLPGLTLLECGVPAADPVVQKSAALVRRQAETLGDVHQNYQRSLAILFLDRLGEPQDRERIQHLALCLIGGQHPTEGGWSYNGPLVERTKVAAFLRLLRQDRQSLATWRKKVLPGGEYDPGGWDNSNTQFAVLALWVAQRHQVPIEKCMALVEKHFRGTQVSSGADPTGNNLNLDGSWYYNANENSGRWPSMTCAGLLGLAVAQAVSKDARAKEQKPLDDPAIQRALAMLAREIDRPGEQRPPDLYFLWSLERVGVLYNLPKIADKDWYAWGSKVLLGRQHDDGHWQDGAYYGSTPALDTCFALLFLKQANLAKDLTSKLQLLEKGE